MLSSHSSPGADSVVIPKADFVVAFEESEVFLKILQMRHIGFRVGEEYERHFRSGPFD